MNNQITLELLPAGKGDCTLIQFENYLMVIDAGFTSTYKDYLKQRLQHYFNKGHRLNKFIVTHIDADHISGALAFFKDNGSHLHPTVIPVEDVWFNSYRHLTLEKEDTVSLPVTPDLPILPGMNSHKADDDEQPVSVKQGSTLGAQLLRGKYPWNKEFQNLAVVTDQPITIPLTENAQLTLLGPTSEALDALAKKWLKKLEDLLDIKLNKNEFFDDAFELLMEEDRKKAEEESRISSEQAVSFTKDWVENYKREWLKEDASPTNGSSITFLLKVGKKKFLFLGDAIPSQITPMLQKLVENGEEYLKVDVVKVAHHGAFSNNSPELIKLVRAKNYIFSSNGKSHDHPHFETLSLILKYHGKEVFKNFIFNYRQDGRFDILKNPDIKGKYNYDVIFPKKDKWGKYQDGFVSRTFE